MLAGKTAIREVREHLEQFPVFNAISPLTNFEIQKHYQNESKFEGVYLRNNLPKMISVTDLN